MDAKAVQTHLLKTEHVEIIEDNQIRPILGAIPTITHPPALTGTDPLKGHPHQMKFKIQDKTGTTTVKDLSRRTAIKEQCLNCSGWSPSERSNCQHTDCELHPYREGKRPDGGSSADRSKAIRSYCLENCCCGVRS